MSIELCALFGVDELIADRREGGNRYFIEKPLDLGHRVWAGAESA
jgi:hypothetical protein